MKLYVGNLPFSVSSDALKEAFSRFGNIEEATVITDKFSNRSKGFGFVTFSDDEEAKKAISEMNGTDLEGREINVSESRPREESDRPRRSFDRNNSRPQGRFGQNRGGRDRNDRRSFGNRDSRRY